MKKASNFTIRRLNIGDLNSYKSIRLEAVKLEPTAFGGSYEDEVKLPDSFYENQLSKVWATDESGVFGAFDSSRNLIGIIGISRRGGRKLSHKAILWGMYIQENFRKMGIGKRLVTEAFRFAQAMKVEFIDLTVVDENRAAVRLYESMGFKTWGNEPAALKLNDKFYAEHHMSAKV